MTRVEFIVLGLVATGFVVSGFVVSGFVVSGFLLFAGLVVASELTAAFLPAAEPEEEELLLVDEELPTLLMVTFCVLPVLAATRLPLVFSAAADIM
jgi:dipeptide/tripeptide permease